MSAGHLITAELARGGGGRSALADYYMIHWLWVHFRWWGIGIFAAFTMVTAFVREWFS